MQSLALLTILESKLGEDVSSQSDLERLYKKGILTSLLKEYKIDIAIKDDLHMILDLLFKDRRKHQYRNKVYITYFYQNLTWNSEYIIALLLKDTASYRNLPRTLFDAIQEFDFTEYKYLTYDDIKEEIFRNLDIKEIYNPNRNQMVCELGRSFSFKNDYDGFDKKYPKLSDYSLKDTENHFIYAERSAFEKIQENNKSIEWVSRNFGDDHGFDELYFDEQKDKEILVEVKGGESGFICLSDNEHNTMLAANNHNAEYQIHKYINIGQMYESVPEIYTYDPKLQRLFNKDGYAFVFRIKKNPKSKDKEIWNLELDPVMSAKTRKK